MIYEQKFKRGDKMNNQDILKALRAKRDIASFARYMHMSTRGVYKLLNSTKPQSNQYYNFMQFIKAQYLESL